MTTTTTKRIVLILNYFRVLCNKPVRPAMVSTLQQRWAATGGMPPQWGGSNDDLPPSQLCSAVLCTAHSSSALATTIQYLFLWNKGGFVNMAECSSISTVSVGTAAQLSPEPIQTGEKSYIYLDLPLYRAVVFTSVFITVQSNLPLYLPLYGTVVFTSVLTTVWCNSIYLCTVHSYLLPSCDCSPCSTQIYVCY